MAKKKLFLSSPQKWSPLMDKVFYENIIAPVISRSDRDRSNNWKPLKIPFNQVREHIIDFGRADFGDGYNTNGINISADDKVLLYCYVNMRGHFWSTYSKFRLEQKTLKKAFSTSEVVLVDIGCGPGTAGLAFLELFTNTAFTYLGVDSSESMRRQCRKLLKAAIAESNIGDLIDVRTTKAWKLIPSQLKNNSVIVFNFSYFFASNSLTPDLIKSLSDTILEITTKFPKNRIFISYSNSARRDLNKNYYCFQRNLGIQLLNKEFKTYLNERTVQFHPRRSSFDIKKEDFVYELFELTSDE